MWEKIKAFFKHSETIFLARLQAIGGVIFAVVMTLDPNLIASYFPAEYVPMWLIAIGLITEIARRHRAKDLDK